MSKHLLSSVVETFNAKLQEQIYTDRLLQEAYRQLSGSFYTPVSVVLQMVSDALEALMVNRLHIDNRQVSAFLEGKVTSAQAQSYLDVICAFKWLDMASGTGVFALVYLDVIRTLCMHYHLDDKFVTRAAQNMYVNDLNPEATIAFSNICTLPVNCLNKDALTELQEQPCIKSILETGGFDLIIGNPPYVGERGNRELFDGYRRHDALAPYYVARMDLFYFFLHLGIDLLKPGGCLCQITTHYFSTADGAWKLRQHMRDALTFSHLRLSRNCEVFEGVKELSVVSFSALKNSPKEMQARCFTTLEWSDKQNADDLLRPQNTLFDVHGQLMIESLHAIDEALPFLTAGASQALCELVQVNQGVVTGMDRVKSEKSSLPVFVYTAEEYAQYLETSREIPENIDHTKALFRPFIKNGMIKPFKLNIDREMYLMYTDGVDVQPDSLVIKRLMPYRERLSKRREVQKGVRAWYQLQWGRDQKIFESPKIVAPQRATRNTFCYLEGAHYASADVYFLTSETLKPHELMGLAAYLNSTLVHGWLFQHGKRKGSLLELYATPLKRIPVPVFSEEDYRLLAALYEAISTGQITPVAGEKEIHIWLCDCLKMPGHIAEALWQWHIVSIQTQQSQ